MLSLAPGSACDVCLEPFDHSSHAPHSIRCGHIFCMSCLHHLSPAICPLCRQPFDTESFIKLHIDLDSLRPLSNGNMHGPQTQSADLEARRLQEAIADIGNRGASEQHLRSVIDECRTFLSSQPRSSFQDLRVSHRMLAYMCEVRSKLKIEKKVVEDLHKEIADKEAEKKEVERKYEDLVLTSRAAKDTATAIEASLREHCDRAQAAYQYMADRYKFVVGEWGRLNEELKLLRSGSNLVDPDYHKHAIDRYPVPEFPQLPSRDADSDLDLKAKIVNPEYLISPLPEFTGGLPSSLGAFAALPDVDSGDGEPEDEESTDDEELEEPSTSSCGAEGCPLNCRCVPFPVPAMPPVMSQRFVMEKSNTVQDLDSTPGPVRHSFRESLATEQASTPVVPDRARSGLSLTMPKTYDRSDGRPSRTQSFSSQRSSRSRSGSRPPSTKPPASPPTASSSRSSLSYSIPPRDTSGQETDHLRRLHDLLQDGNVSASLPNMSSAHFMANRTDSNRATEVSRPPSRSASTSAHSRPLPPRPDNQVAISLSTNPLPISVPPPRASEPSQMTVQRPMVVSTASSAALALEKAQKERRDAERERLREDRRSEKERDRQDRPRQDSDRQRPQQVPPSSTSTALMTSQNPTSYRHREEGGFTALPTSGSTLRREGSFHQRVTPSSLRDSTYAPAQQYTHHSVKRHPIGSDTRVTGLYA
ncbi:hypothetical protein PC9H_001881 [Pleurotus ostreatus]|uniref:RING-type domain-containing protein n=1 Tax=Pleurotus ostreatus TaxID=5322 RepID=A0A8H6ZKP2_PLEOS|nr:uncharacterized protein PC9H_001881 [Pleurotus ostreatus]KAF7419294.1 hypothetical protein PC9H_001881 [Pleurotus ostreatus]